MRHTADGGGGRRWCFEAHGNGAVQRRGRLDSDGRGARRGNCSFGYGPLLQGDGNRDRGSWRSRREVRRRRDNGRLWAAQLARGRCAASSAGGRSDARRASAAERGPRGRGRYRDPSSHGREYRRGRRRAWVGANDGDGRRSQHGRSPRTGSRGGRDPRRRDDGAPGTAGRALGVCAGGRGQRQSRGGAGIPAAFCSFGGRSIRLGGASGRSQP